MMSKLQLEELGRQIVDAAYQVHYELGPGLLESAYQKCLVYELRSRGIEVIEEVEMPVNYKEVEIDVGYRVDLLVANEVIVELKAVIEMKPVFMAQIITYLRLSENSLGYLINFNVKKIKDGIKRVVNDL